MKTLASIEGSAVSTNKLGSLVGTDADLIREVRFQINSKLQLHIN